MKIEDVMTRRVVAARADTDLSHVARLMWENDCGVVPVVDAEDRVVGIVTDRDLCMGANFAGRSLRELRVASCMAREVTTCRADDDPQVVAQRMGARRIRRLPVTDEEGRLIGLVSLADLLCAATRASAKERKELQAAVVASLTAICARTERGEVEPALPAKKRSAAPGKGNAKRRAKV
jgi:CBS-domain-containing membrane protein